MPHHLIEASYARHLLEKCGLLSVAPPELIKKISNFQVNTARSRDTPLLCIYIYTV
ncbi:MAG: hypothetical protein RMY33_000955 [Nostoc sp. DedQUE03]|nr:hypothetical protein [Nostoc sp. DedQUE02]